MLRQEQKSSNRTRGQTLGENVSNLEASWHMQDTNKTFLYMFPNKVNIKLNMLSSLMLNRVSRQVDGADIVTVNQ
ncbi:hypothetical protein HanIR_Chr09g0393601 [Helianthus annuus]|nr:hypothetical protein HanIR_Chr09g0393601 [Helianthus annuus]